MITFKEFLYEAKKITIYHGDNHKTTKLEPKMMMHEKSNNQEGVGIYFGTLEIAKKYGKDIISVDVDPKRFLPSRDLVSDHIPNSKIVKLLSELYKADKESFYYFITDYVEVYEIEDVERYHLEELADMLKNGEIRNFQIELAEIAGVEVFVNLWNKVFSKIDGTYDKMSDFYAIINPNIKVTEVK